MISERDFKDAVAFRVRLIRASEKETQATFAKRIRVGDSAVSMYENGERAIDPFQALLLKQQLAFPLEWIYAGEELNLTDVLKEKLKKAHEIVAAERAATKRPGRPRSPKRKKQKVG